MELRTTIVKDVKQYSEPITESSIKNLLKKPANGGIPATAKIVKAKVTAKIQFFDPIPDKFIKYLGCIVLALAAFIKSEKVVMLKHE